MSNKNKTAIKERIHSGQQKTSGRDEISMAKTKEEVKDISFHQLEWLLEGFR